jgi:hypothetical protein
MSKIITGLALALFTSVGTAAPDPQCAEHDTLRTQRDDALRSKNFKQYCQALSGLIRLMPATPPATPRLQCEAKATGMSVPTWLGIRPSVIDTMVTTFNEQCK